MPGVRLDPGRIRRAGRVSKSGDSRGTIWADLPGGDFQRLLGAIAAKAGPPLNSFQNDALLSGADKLARLLCSAGGDAGKQLYPLSNEITVGIA